MENQKENPDLSIIIVSWNVLEKLRENLKALFNSDGNFDFEVFVVDNNSADGSVEMVKNEFSQVHPVKSDNASAKQFNGIKLIANKENLGFAKANNQAIKKAKGKFILLLNPDMRVMPNTLINIIKWMRENKQADAAGCHLIDENNNTINHVRRFPTVWDQLAIILKLPHIFPSILNKYLRNNFNYSKPAKVDSIRGGFFMIRTSPPAPLLSKEKGDQANRESGAMNKILLDERYFLWFEEVDFCRQIQQAGGEVWYTPVAQCVDYVGQSFKQLPRGQAQKYFRDSMLKYFKKWHPAWEYWALRMAWQVGMFLAWIGERVKFKSIAKT